MSSSPETKKQVRVWADGCYGWTHWGHLNSLRQAKELGDYLVVGVHSDEEIRKHKGPPVMSMEERIASVKACKWVDEVVADAPYNTMLSVLNEHNIDFCVHGEDITTNSDGVDTYAEVKAAGRYRTIKRTEGVSTTDLVGRMLLLTKDHHSEDKHPSPELTKAKTYTPMSTYTATTQQIVQFSNLDTAPTEKDTVVYVDGAFDLFHYAHAKALESAKALGTYLVVGVHADIDVNTYKGHNYPVQNLSERVLSVLSCRYVNEVVIGAPFELTEDFLNRLKVNIVAHGDDEIPTLRDIDPYKYPKEKDMMRIFKSCSDITTTEIVKRILEHRMEYLKRNESRPEMAAGYV